MTENKGTKVQLVDGTIHEIEAQGVFFVCGICGDEYGAEPYAGYCDNTALCAGDDLEHLIVLPR